MKALTITVIVLAVLFSGTPSIARADEGMHFHCSVCGSHSHGSMWHDSDKDGTNDR